MKQNVKVLVILLGLTAGLASYGFAEETSDVNSAAQTKIAQLRALRNENPEAFREQLKKHREEVKAKLQKLRQL